jgi:ABC-type dipeptide/oligopeptide/nickel transport system permease component
VHEKLFAAVRRHRWWMLRIVAFPVQLAVFGLVVFFLIRTIPGDPVRAALGPDASDEVYLRVQQQLGLDGSLLDQLGRFYTSLFTFDLGTSTATSRPVVAEVAVRLPATIELALMCLVALVVVAVPASYYAVMRPRGPVGRSIRAYARTAGAVPEFCIGVAMIFVFYAWLRWAPAPLGRVSPDLAQPTPITRMPFVDSVLTGDWAAAGSMLQHLVLPLLVSVIAQAAVVIRLLVAGLESSIDAAPTRFRIATGASRWSVTVSVYRRALPSATTMLGTIFGYLLGGAVVIETLFGFTGIGQYMVDSVNSKDLIAMQGLLIVIGLIALIVFLLVDVTVMLLDPRRKPGLAGVAR